MRKEEKQLWQVIEPHVKGANLELVELHFGREPEGFVLRVFIDTPWDGEPPHLPGQPANDLMAPKAAVGHEDCERVSRDVSAALDVADVIAHAYRLEVSSPGIDRPLRRVQDFRRFAGQKAKIRTTDAVEGRRNFSGVIRDAHDGVVDLECDGRLYQVPMEHIARANLVPDWDAEFRKANRAGAADLGSTASERGGSKGPSQGPLRNRSIT